MNEFSIGEKFGRLLVISYKGKNKHHKSLVLTKCDCGNESVKLINSLRSGKTKSCGCLHKETSKSTMKKINHLGRNNRLRHGYSKKPEFYIWRSMKARCLNPKQVSYPRYGGRNIKICDRWIKSFDNFINDMGERPSKNHILDRIDFNGDYTKDNCRWVTQYISDRNRSSNKFFTYKGKTLIESDWSKKLGLQRGAIQKRLNKGWTLEAALSTPKLSRKQRKKCNHLKYSQD